MSQHNIDFSENPSGAELMDDYLDTLQENNYTSNSGTERPAYARAGTMWLDISQTPWSLKLYDGADDITMGRFNPTSNEFIMIHPLTTNGDIMVCNALGNLTRLPAGNTDLVLTANGSGQMPSYKKPPIGVYTYSQTREFNINDVAVSSGDTGVSLYRSKVNGNVNHALSDTTYWDAYVVGITNWGDVGGNIAQQADLQAALALKADNTKFQKVSSLPSSPDENTIYFITD